jgi:hypothetical protein
VRRFQAWYAITPLGRDVYQSGILNGQRWRTTPGDMLLSLFVYNKRWEPTAQNDVLARKTIYRRVRSGARQNVHEPIRRVFAELEGRLRAQLRASTAAGFLEIVAPSAT